MESEDANFSWNHLFIPVGEHLPTAGLKKIPPERVSPHHTLDHFTDSLKNILVNRYLKNRISGSVHDPVSLPVKARDPQTFSVSGSREREGIPASGVPGNGMNR